MANSATSTLVIKELTGQKRVVTLRGPSLPFNGAGWGGTQRVTTTWYPGNAAEATQHVLGPTESESNWDGRFSTSLMLRTPSFFESPGGSAKGRVQRASTLVTILEDIFRLGQRLRVEWQNTLPRSATIPTPNGPLAINSVLPEETYSVIREGRCTDWNWVYKHADDIDWDMTFEWASRGAVQQKILTRRTETTTTKIQEMVTELARASVIANAVSGAIDRRNLKTLPNTFTLGDVENILNGPKDTLASFAQTANLLTNRFKKIGELIQQVRTTPVSLLNQLLDVANNAIGTTTNFIDTMNRTPPEVSLANTKINQLTKSTAFFGDAITQAEVLENAAIGLRTLAQDAASNNQTILAVHIVRGVVPFQPPPIFIPNPPAQPVLPPLSSGEITNVISSNFYGTPDHAASILRANRLPLSQLVVERGTILIIPTLDALRQFNPEGN